MKIFFKYDLQKDTENFLKSFESVNNKKPTKLQELYMTEVGELEPTKVPAFLQKQTIATPEKLKKIESDWRRIEAEVVKRMEKLFPISIPFDVTVYLSTNSRCTYNVQGNYFFVYMNSENPNGIIVHELMHFYTWYAFYKELEEKGVSAEKYNDIKESLAELINIDFQDLLGTYYDKGYPQHLEIRKKVNHLRKEGKNIQNIVKELY